MRKYGWKWLGVALLAISFTAGLLIPLKPGIASLDGNTFPAGKNAQIAITGYNTDFSYRPDSVRAWLALDSPSPSLLTADTSLSGGTYRPLIEATAVKVAHPRRVDITFQIPPALPGKTLRQTAHLLTDDPANGLIMAAMPVFLVQDSADPVAAVPYWNQEVLEGTHQHNGLAFPYLKIVFESIRNMFYHVPMWFAMMLLMLLSTIYAILYLSKTDPSRDHWSQAFASTGTLFGFLGLLTGAVWARYTWGQYWSFDDKQITAAIALFIYLAYFVLRMSLDDPEKQARLAAVYNIFAFATLIPLLFIIPRLSASSNHPGSQGNPAFGQGDLDANMRWIFWMAVAGWILIGIWMSELVFRYKKLQEKLYFK